MPARPFAALLAACMAACAPGTDGGAEAGVPPRTDTSGTCAGYCDAAAPTIPVITDTSGYGDVTVYGDVTDPRPSPGGACNYGPGGITDYAAIQESLLPGDLKGQWRGGRACGQCVEVRARTPSGWKSATARIVDKCPDAHCGIDLGGAPAKALMGDKPGRYSGEWRFIPCDGLAGVSDGPPTLVTKEGTNAWWSLAQVRNPAGRVLSIRIRKAGTPPWAEMPWATEAENFFKVPDSVLQDPSDYELAIDLPYGRGYALVCKGTDLSRAGAVFALSAVP